MAVYFNPSRNRYALISYKVLYSRFRRSDAWQFQDNWPTLRLFSSAVKRGRWSGAYHVIRHPEARILSFFMDKFRQQPLLVEQADFAWQPCHRLFFPWLQRRQGDADADIAEAFLQCSFDDFIDWLPSVFQRDTHLQPQCWSRRVRLRRRSLFTWPGLKVIRLEDGQHRLEQIPDIDFSRKTNPSAHLPRDFEVTERQRQVLRRLYAADYRYGGYR